MQPAPSSPIITRWRLDEVDRHWRWLTIVAWAAVTLYYLWERSGPIHWLALGDTDDNMRLMQVRAWLNGQGWYDLRQYRMNPPQGFDIHWSRIVDLPIAAMILAFRPFLGEWHAEKLACGIAPLLPLSIAMLGLSATVRRLVHPLAWPLALVILVMSCAATMTMFMPLRIDHHGWQLAMLSVTVAGLCDPARRRGGALVGIATAVSLNIGLEMLPYAAVAGAILTLRWVWDRGEAGRLAAYGATLGGGGAAGYAAFASYADRVMRCDAFTPVWLSAVVIAGGLLLLLALASPASRVARLAAALAAAAAIAAGFVHFFPQCLGRPEQVSPELAKNWLDNVKEAKPIYKQAFRVAFPIVTLPVIGVIGAAVAAWRARGTRAEAGWAAVGLFTAASLVLLVWQTRAGPAAQLLSVPAATALAWWLLPLLVGSRYMLVRVLGTVAAFLVITGLFAGLAIQYLPADRPNAYTRRVNRAGNRCAFTPYLATLDRYPAQTVFTFVDLGPRLITVTHHDAVAGPYHRNGDAILDVQHAFGRSADEAHAIMRRHGATLLLICPDMAESTIYRARNPGGFYDQLAHGHRPAWLQPLPLPAHSPYRLFRIG